MLAPRGPQPAWSNSARLVLREERMPSGRTSNGRDGCAECADRLSTDRASVRRQLGPSGSGQAQAGMYCTAGVPPGMERSPLRAARLASRVQGPGRALGAGDHRRLLCRPLKLKMPGGGNEAEKRLRLDAIRRAEVWRPTQRREPRSSKGARNPRRVCAECDVQCDYVDEKMSGRSPKFTCALGPQRRGEGQVRQDQRRSLRRGRRDAAVVGAGIRRRRHVSGPRHLPGMPADLGGRTANRREVLFRSRRHRAQDEGHGARVGRHGGLVVVGARLWWPMRMPPRSGRSATP